MLVWSTLVQVRQLNDLARFSHELLSNKLSLSEIKKVEFGTSHSPRAQNARENKVLQENFSSV